MINSRSKTALTCRAITLLQVGLKADKKESRHFWLLQIAICHKSRHIRFSQPGRSESGAQGASGPTAGRLGLNRKAKTPLGPMILWMDETLHHFETIVLVQGKRIISGCLRWCEMDFATIHSMTFQKPNGF